MFAFIILFACLLPLVYWEYKIRKLKKVIKHTTGPKTLPLLGNAHQVGKTPSEILKNLFNWWYEFQQDNFTLWIGPHLNILISNVKDVEYVLSSKTLIQKSDMYDTLQPWLGDGLLISTGSKWHKRRKMITPSFHFNVLHDFLHIMNVNSNKFVHKLRNLASVENIFDFQKQVHYFTLDVICETAMGVQINALDNHDSDIATAFKDICYITNMRVFHPLQRSEFIYKFYPAYKHYSKTLKILQDFTYKVIANRIKSRKVVNTKDPEVVGDEFRRAKTVFLDTLLSATLDNKPLTMQEIYEEVSTFIFEGHDTTSSAITFVMHLLSRHLAVQKKVYKEQQLIMGDNMKRDATLQELTDMKYLDLVIKECLRLYPSVPIIARFTDKDYNLNGKVIPKNISLNIFIIGLGYNEEIFPDPYRFRPERFDSSNRTQNTNPFGYVPFSAGLRNCIGQKFAQLEIKSVISKLVRYFEILPALDELISKDGYVSTQFGPHDQNTSRHKYEPLLSLELTLKSENGVYLRLKERN